MEDSPLSMAGPAISGSTVTSLKTVSRAGTANSPMGGSSELDMLLGFSGTWLEGFPEAVRVRDGGLPSICYRSDRGQRLQKLERERLTVTEQPEQPPHSPSNSFLGLVYLPRTPSTPSCQASPLSQ